MAFLRLVLVLLAGVHGTAGDNIFNCSKITPATDANAETIANRKSECLQSGWCLWSNDVCLWDGCLQYISTAGYNNGTESCPASGGVTGSSCKMFYLTGVHDCTTGAEIDVTDIYCRENSASYEHVVIDLCFYADLKNRAEKPDTYKDTTSFVEGGCKANTTNGIGSYVYTTSFQDCTATTTTKDYCACLGKDWCHLKPECTLGAGDQKDTCVEDPCNKFNQPLLQTNPGCTLAPTYCETKQLQQVTGTGAQSITTGYGCFSKQDTPNAKKNTDWNECYYGYYGTETKSNAVCPDAAARQESCADYPECNIVSKRDACTGAVVYDETGPTQEECKLVEIPRGYFPTNFYCNDGRNVPSFGASSLISVPSFLGVLLLALLAFIF